MFRRRKIIGIAKDKEGFRTASVLVRGKKVELGILAPKESLEGIGQEKGDVTVTGLAGSQLLIRHFSSSLKTKKALRKTIPFQLEAALPYALDEVVVKPVYTVKKEGAEALFFIAAMRYLEEHLQEWEVVDPDVVSALPVALYRFARFSCPTATSYLILHLGEEETEVLSVIDQQLRRYVTLPLGQAAFVQACCQDKLLGKQGESLDLLELDKETAPQVAKKLTEWKAHLSRALLFFEQKGEKKALSQVFLTGETDFFSGWEAWLARELSLSLIPLDLACDYDAKTVRRYASALGLSLDAAYHDKVSVQFRQREFASQVLVKRVARLVATTGLASLGTAAVALVGVYASAKYKKEALWKKCQTVMAYYEESLPELKKAARAQTLEEGLRQVDRAVRGGKKKKALEALPPPVTKVMAKLASHPKLCRQEGAQKIKIWAVDYRQDQQPHLKLAFHSPVAEWARDFHDAVMEDQSWVDNSKKITWDRQGDLYEMAFYLKK